MKKIELTIEEIVQDLRRVNEIAGSLSKSIYNTHGTWSYSRITKEKPFNELKGIALGEDKMYKRNASKEELIEDALRVHEEEGKLTQDLYLAKGNYSRKPILRLFGSWNNFMKEMELPINCLINIPDEDLLADLIRIYDEYDNISASVVKHHGKYCVEVYQRRFGSFNNAIEKVGLNTKVRGKTSPIANSMIQLIEDLIKEQAIPEATAEWFINPETGRKLYVDAFFPAHNLAFEYNGPQHYVEVDHYGGNHNLQHRIKLDKLKEDSLRDKGFKLLIFKYDEPHTREHMIVRLAEVFKQ